MNDIQFTFQFGNYDEDCVEILTALLGDAGFNSFRNTEDKLFAFIDSEFLTDRLNEILSLPVFSECSISFSKEHIKKVNWNAKWESSYKPILIDRLCAILAPFHTEQGTEYTIHIEPKMSFGTGHHETTRLMIRQIYTHNFKEKRVLDMGCGTGVLGIFALMRGASFVTGVDIDEWACENSLENFEKNGIDRDKYQIYLGDSTAIEEELPYDIILANINRNVLLNDMHIYSRLLKSRGMLILSGILSKDRQIISAKTSEHKLKFVSENVEKGWLSQTFTK